MKKNNQTKKQQIKLISWALFSLVLLLALIVWASERFGGQNITLYSVFPLLGLGAFSIMWTHYILGSVRRIMGVEARDNKTYLKFSSWLVLVLILLHPGLLIFQLYRDGLGLPPQSYLQLYAEPAMKGAIMLGTIALLIFLAYEFRKKFYKKTWWKFVNWAQIFAMYLIFYHGLTLGRELNVGWYRNVWFFYGISLLAAVLYNSWYDRKVKNKKEAV